MSDGNWDRVQRALDRLIREIDRDLQGCFALSTLLASELYPTFTSGQRGRDVDAELAYLRNDYVACVRRAIQAIESDFPCLAGVDLDLSGETVTGAAKRIEYLWQHICELLRNPAGAPGSLGLILDRSGCRVCRADRCQNLGSASRWDVLAKLERSGPEFVSRDAMAAVWWDGPPSPAALDRAISDLRAILKPLGLCVTHRRNIGWRLEVMSPDSQSGD